MNYTPEQQRSILVEYMQLKMYLHDWHGIADVANDIRELEARFPELKSDRQPG